jgi:hypothetical protein
MRTPYICIHMKQKTKEKDEKINKNISIRPSVVETAEKKASRVAQKLGIKEINFSQFIEIAINDYNAE